MKIFVIILNYKGWKDTKECLHSVLASSYTKTEIVVVDNGSNDASVSILRDEFPHITIIETGANLGYAGGNNVGIRYALKAGADAIFVLNNDTILEKECLTNFAKESSKRPNSVLGGRVYYYDSPNEMQHFGGVWIKKKGKFKNLPDAYFDREKSHDLDFVTGCALFVPRAIFEKVGLFEEAFFLYYEEIDWCFRARKQGYTCTYVPSPIIWHKESKSFFTPKPPQSYFQWRNRLFFIERNMPRSEYYMWLLTKLPRRLFLLIIKQYLRKLDILFFGSSPAKKTSLLATKAGILGIRHYFSRSFGNAPPWIFILK